MSTKFSGLAKTQKPPAVCKKPPFPDPIILPPFAEQIFQGYAEWYDPEGSNDVQVSGFMTMQPDPVANSWTGRTPGLPWSLEVLMSFAPPFEAFDYIVTLLHHGTFADSYTEPLVLPRSMTPFDSGLVIMTQTTGLKRVLCRIMT